MRPVFAVFGFLLVFAMTSGAQAQSIHPNQAATALTPVSGASTASPVTQPSGQPETRPSAYDRIWRFAEWYNDKTNPVVQRVAFSGRFQHEFAALDADEGSLEEWNVRRLRLGPRITLFRTFTLHAEVELNPQERDPLYLRFTDFYLQWSRSARLAVTAGKHGAFFTMDGSTSSKELLAIDRSNLSGNIWFPQEYMPGVSVSGRLSPWIYRAGIYSPGGANREFGAFDGSFFTLGVLGYDFKDALDANEATLATNYVYQRADQNNTFTRQLEHIVSLTFKFDRDAWGLRTDVSAAGGYLGQSDLWGLMAMPFVNATDKLQIVGRYTLLDSDEPNGVRLATYESRLVAGRGDRYTEFYLGANYYFYGHKLKLQTGLQHAEMEDRADDGGAYSGLSWTTGLRIGW